MIVGNWEILWIHLVISWRVWSVSNWSRVMICFGCLKRFRGSNIIGYFSNIRLSKNGAASVSLFGTTSANILIDEDDAQIGDT